MLTDANLTDQARELLADPTFSPAMREFVVDRNQIYRRGWQGIAAALRRRGVFEPDYAAKPTALGVEIGRLINVRLIERLLGRPGRSR